MCLGLPTCLSACVWGFFPSGPGKQRHLQQLEEALESKSRTVVAEDTRDLARAARELASSREREGRSQVRASGW